MKIFCDEIINTGRQKELDWARGLAVFFMILVHVKMELPGFPLTDAYSKIIEFFGRPPAAPVFMILLGAGITYSKNNAPKILAMRGLKLIIMHYALNLFAFALPRLITGMPEVLENLFAVDILAFAGFTFLFFALKEKLRMRTVHLVLAAFVISCLNYLFTHPIEGLWLRAVTGLFVRTSEHSYFPFLSWFGYPVIGYVFGELLKRCTDKRLFYKYLFVFSALTVIVISLGSMKYGFDIWVLQFMAPDYFYQDFIQYILIGGICFSWISILYALSGIRALEFIGKQLSRWSKNTTPIYFVHYVIIGWLAVQSFIVFPVDSLVNFVTGIAVIIAADILVCSYKRFLKRRNPL